MVESERRQPRREGLAGDAGFVRRDLYSLLTAVFASEHFAFAEGLPHDHLGGLVSDLEEIEIERSLLTVAIGVRTLLGREEDYIASASVSVCGNLVSMLAAGTKDEPLTLREACNKIIHASKIRFDVDHARHPTKLNPVLYVYGEKYGQGWKARLDLIAFAELVASVT